MQVNQNQYLTASPINHKATHLVNSILFQNAGQPLIEYYFQLSFNFFNIAFLKKQNKYSLKNKE